MRYENNDRLRQYLDRGAAGAFREHMRHPGFELDASAFSAALGQVREQHPDLSDDEAEARAVFRLLTSGAPPEIAVALPSRWYRARAWTLRAAPLAWPWLKLAWAAAVLFFAALAAAELSAIRAHAAPLPEPDRAANVVDREAELHALLLRPPALVPQLAGGSFAARVQFLNGSSAWTNVSASNPLPMTCISGCSGGGGGGGTSSNFGSAFPSAGTAIGAKNGSNMVNLTADGSNNLNVNCVVGCSASAGFGDNAAFTAGTTAIGITGGWYSTSPTNCTSGSGCAPQLTQDRKLFVQDFQGTSPWVVSNGGTFAVQAAESGTWTVTGAGGTFPVTGTFWQTTQPVSGTFWQATQPISIADGQAVTLGNKADAKSAATDSTAISVMQVLKEISAMEQAPASTPVTGTFWQSTQPVSLASLPALPAGTNSIGTVVLAADPCQGAQTALAINEATSSLTTIISGTSGKHTYICSLNLVTATAQNINLVAGTGTNCGTTVHVGFFGGTTAATGWNLAANGGLTLAGGGFHIAGGTDTAADNICYTSSSTGQVSGTVTYVQQ